MGAATAGAAAGAALAAELAAGSFLGAFATGAFVAGAFAAGAFAAAELEAVLEAVLAGFFPENTPFKNSILFYTTISARAALSLSAVYAGSSFYLHPSLEKYSPYQAWMSVV